MSELELVIGNKNYSSWSLRPWLVLAHHQVPFVERQVWLYTDEGREELRRISPTAKVPLLRHGDRVVWDSLAICEYLAELHPELGLWPSDAGARAMARSLCAEMHAGFGALRNEMPMNCRLEGAAITPSKDLEADLARIRSALGDALSRFGGPGGLLFGEFSIADAMYAPVALRFRAYGVAPEGDLGAWLGRMLELPALRLWIEAGRSETRRLPDYEVL